MKKLPKFNEKAKCRKCGYRIIESDYVRYDEVGENPCGLFVYSSMAGRGSKEAIIRTCGRCKFKWLEAVK